MKDFKKHKYIIYHFSTSLNLPAVTSMWNWKRPGSKETGSLPPVLFQLSKHLLRATARSGSLLFLLDPRADAHATPTSQTIQLHNANTRNTIHTRENLCLCERFLHSCIIVQSWDCAGEQRAHNTGISLTSRQFLQQWVENILTCGTFKLHKVSTQRQSNTFNLKTAASTLIPMSHLPSRWHWPWG